MDDVQEPDASLPTLIAYLERLPAGAEAGRLGNPCDCPVARMIKRQGFTDVSVGVEDESCSAAVEWLVGFEEYSAPLATGIASFIERFDKLEGRVGRREQRPVTVRRALRLARRVALELAA